MKIRNINSTEPFLKRTKCKVAIREVCTVFKEGGLCMLELRTRIKPFRAYFTIDKTASQAASRVLELDGVINEVEKIKTNNKNIKSDVFNTEGVKVKSKVDSATLNNLSNGIYIIGGKKVMVKH